MTRIVHLTSGHRSNDIRVFRKECRSLAAAGYEVVLVAPFAQDEHVDGVQIRGIPGTPNRYARMTLTPWHVFCAALRERGDLYHYHDPELIPIGVLLKLLGKRVIYDAHEHVAKDFLSKEWVPVWARPLLSRIARAVEAVAVRCVDGVVAATPAIARQFLACRTALVQNFAIRAEFPVNEPAHAASRRPLVLFTGCMCRERGIQELVTAIALLPESLDVRLCLAGWFDPPELVEELARRPGWSRVDFLGKLSPEAVIQLLHEARVGVVTFLPTPNLIEAQPNKLFEYMAAGLPMVASDFPWWRQLVASIDCGRLVNPSVPQEIADAIRWLFEHPREAEEMGRRGQLACQETYNWERESEQLLALYRRIVGDAPEAERTPKPTSGVELVKAA